MIPWEGRRLVEAVRDAALKLKGAKEVRLVAHVSEGPLQGHKLESQLREILSQAGVPHARVVVLCAYKQGYSWLMDEIAPELAGKPVDKIQIDFAKNTDPTGMRAMFSTARWVQELYPVDEMLARKLNLRLEQVTLNQIEAGGPTYRVHAFDAKGQEILKREFTVSSVIQPYSSVVPNYEKVQVETGWVRMECDSRVVLDRRIKTDLEEFWDHYQNKTLPKVFQHVMSQTHGELRQEFAPPFDTLKLDIHMSEPDYELDLDKERIPRWKPYRKTRFIRPRTS